MILRVWRGKEEGEEAPPSLLPFLMSSQTALPLASAVAAPGFCRLPALGLTTGLSPSTSLSAAASFLDLATADNAIILCV